MFSRTNWCGCSLQTSSAIDVSHLTVLWCYYNTIEDEILGTPYISHISRRWSLWVLARLWDRLEWNNGFQKNYWFVISTDRYDAFNTKEKGKSVVESTLYPWEVSSCNPLICLFRIIRMAPTMIKVTLPPPHFSIEFATLYIYPLSLQHAYY